MKDLKLYKDTFLTNEAARCMLCEFAPCTNACDKGCDPARMVMSVRMDNIYSAAKHIDKEKCAGCGKCMDSCIMFDRPVDIGKMAEFLPETQGDNYSDVDLSVTFCGIKFENPFLLSSSVVASGYDMCAKALEMGWGGVVFKTIGFIKPKEASPRFSTVAREGNPFIGLRNLEQISDHELYENLECMKKLKENYPGKIIISSIMGRNKEEWQKLAILSQEYKADMLELNFSCPHMTENGVGSDVGQNPALVEEYTRYVKESVSIPVLAKMTPNIGNMEIPAIGAKKGGADGIAAINTIKSVGDIDIETMVPIPEVADKSTVCGYSGKAVKPIALRFIHDMAVNGELKNIPISGMGGIETWKDACEFIALGCGTVQVTTAVMQYGYRIIEDITDGTKRFLKRSGYMTVENLVGKAIDSIEPADELDRKTVSFPIVDRNKCLGCGRCFIACYDAGHQAITFSAEKRIPVINAKKCVGCHLCILVCPCGVINKSKRVKLNSI